MEGIGDLFVDQDYQIIDFQHEDVNQPCYALKTSATDYDLTGQVIWKGAEYLS